MNTNTQHTGEQMLTDAIASLRDFLKAELKEVKSWRTLSDKIKSRRAELRLMLENIDAIEQAVLAKAAAQQGAALLPSWTLDSMRAAIKMAEKNIMPTETLREIYAALSAAPSSEPRSCTCHPDDSPPRPCAQKFALSDCLASQGADAVQGEPSDEEFLARFKRNCEAIPSPVRADVEASGEPIPEDWKTDLELHYEKALRHLAENAFARKDWQYARDALAAAPSLTGAVQAPAGDRREG